MNILTKFLIRSDFVSNIKTSNFICDEAMKCLDPLLEVFIYGDSAHQYTEISTSLSILSSYVGQLHALETKLTSSMNSHEAVLKKYNKKYQSTLENIQSVHNEITKFNIDIKKTKGYQASRHLSLATESLTKIEEQINNNHLKS